MMRCGIFLFLLAIPQLANSARMQTRTQQVRRQQKYTTLEAVMVKKLRHGGWFGEYWDARYLMLNEYDDESKTVKLEYSSSPDQLPKVSFSICADKVRAGIAAGRGTGAFQIYTSAGHKHYVFKPTKKGSDLTTILKRIQDKAKECNSEEAIIKEGIVQKARHTMMGFDEKFMTLSSGPGKNFILEYISLEKNLKAMTWDVCHDSFEVKNGGTNKFTIMSDVDKTRGRKYDSYTFKGVGVTDTEKQIEAKDWRKQIEDLQEKCDEDEEDVVLPQVPVVEDVVVNEESTENEPKAKLALIDASTENLLELKQMIMANADKIPIRQTLVAFDFDLTLRDDDPEGGIMLRQEATTRELLEWLKENEAPAIIVTARKPRPQTFYRTWKQAVDIGLENLIGQHVPALKTDVEGAEPCRTEDSPCDVIKYKHDYGHFAADLTMVEGHGLVAADYTKGEAILKYIENHGLDIKQVIFADDYVTNSVNVARVCEKSESIESVVGVWFAPFDVESGTKEFVDGINENTAELKTCLLSGAKFSECKERTKYGESWCSSTVEGFLGDNGYSPRQPENLWNVEAVLLGHVPVTEEEKVKPNAAFAEASQQEEEILLMLKMCKDAEKKEEDDLKKAELAKFAEAGQLPPCTGTVQCMKAIRMKEKATCDKNADACAHLL